jgi:hypothetical protein
MTTTLSITQSAVLGIVRGFLLSILPAGVEVVKGQDNRVPEPSSPNYVVMTPLFQPRLRTNIDTYDDTFDPLNPDPAAPGFKMSEQGTELRLQLDVHGPASADNSVVITTLWRDAIGCEFFAASDFDIAPLYCDDPKQTAFIDEGAQYEDRWTIDAHLQFNPVVTTGQQFAGNLGPIGLVNVEATYPAGDS